MSNEEALFEINRSIGRFEARFDAQDEALNAIRADVAELKARPDKRRAWIGKVIGGALSAFIAAFALFHFGIRK